MDVREFDFDLPPELIAQEATADRGAARLLFLDRGSGSLAHTRVNALPDLLRPGDLLVVNNTRVFPARLIGRRIPTGGAVECLLIMSLADAAEVASRSLADADQVASRSPADADQVATGSQAGGDQIEKGTVALWEALVHPGQKLKPGAR